MKKPTLALCLVSFAALSLASEPSLAQDALSNPKPGPEVAALAKFFGNGSWWLGNIPAGVMGIDSKSMTSRGKAYYKKTLDGFWYTCDVQETVGSGKTSVTWKAHMMVGWDVGTRTYRAVNVDNTGMLTHFTGTLDGNTFALETVDPVMMMGQMVKDRQSWTLNDDGTVVFKDEHQSAAGEWVMVESATTHPFTTKRADTKAPENAVSAR